MDAAQLRPLSIGEILDVAIKIYRARFAHLVKAVAVVQDRRHCRRACLGLPGLGLARLRAFEGDEVELDSADPVTRRT